LSTPKNCLIRPAHNGSENGSRVGALPTEKEKVSKPCRPSQLTGSLPRSQNQEMGFHSLNFGEKTVRDFFLSHAKLARPKHR
jgi:hypothetical protein